MTHLRDSLIQEIEDLPPEDLMDVFEMVLNPKEKGRTRSKNAKPVYLEVQEILKKCTGSFSTDIGLMREDKL
jgi:hypothetical protein